MPLTNSLPYNTKNTNYASPLLWLILACYILLATYSILHHEPWGDELHSWNISKGSHSYSDLISNIRYEGHPPVWYTVMWTISKCTHQYVWLQLFHLSMASLVVFVILFHSPFSTFNKILIPFGYYFLFEYAMLSRNYVIGVLAAFLICVLFQRNYKYKIPLYYLLLFIMSNTHLLAAILAGCLHFYFLLDLYEKKIPAKKLTLHIALGALMLMPSLYNIWPPTDSELGAEKWLQRWNTSQLAIDMQAPLRAFIPIPAWWKLNFWNQQFLLDLHTQYGALKFVYPILVIILIAVAFYLLRGSKKAVLFFAANLLLTFIIGNVLTLGTQRHTGFIFISFLIAYWLGNKENASQKYTSSSLLNGLLVIQMIAGIFSIIKDNALPFSNFYRINELLHEVPANDKLVTDYWTLIAVSAYSDKPVYSIDMQETVAFSLWKNNMLKMRLTPYRYCNGLNHLFNNSDLKTVYLISSTEPKLLADIDSRLFTSFNIELIDKREGAIEKSSNLYLYKISPLQ